MITRRAQRGYSLIELLVSLVLLGLALTLSTRLWMESARIMAESGRTARDPILTLATQRIRVDVQEALAWVPLGGGLVLERVSGQVVYVRDGSLLVRETRDANGDLVNRRPILDHVTRFTSREIAPGIVEVVIGARIRYRAHVTALTGRVNAPSPGREKEVRLVLALRSAAGGRGW